MATTVSPTAYKNFINGEFVEARGGKGIENRNPANTDELVGIFPASTAQDMTAAVDAAKAAYPKWRLTPAPKRAEILYRAAEILIRRKEDIGARHDARDGQSAGRDARRRAGSDRHDVLHGRRRAAAQFGQTTPSELPDKFAMSVRTPIGVAGLITPWNFPMAIPSWKIMPALVCGNTVVIKPAEDTPLSTYNLVQVLAEAGLPHGVLNMVYGDRPGGGKSAAG